jgi:hypothetical protein
MPPEFEESVMMTSATIKTAVANSTNRRQSELGRAPNLPHQSIIFLGGCDLIFGSTKLTPGMAGTAMSPSSC